MTEVVLKNISKRFKNVTAVDDVSFEIKDGEFFVLLGPTGAGKTTTLRLIAGLEKLDEGTISFDGEIINEISMDAPQNREVVRSSISAAHGQLFIRTTRKLYCVGQE